jgi:thioredoxin 1
MSVIQINRKNIEEIKKSGKPVLLDFYADWCGPCRALSPLVHQIASEHPEYAVGKINVGEEPELASSFGVLSIPALFVLRDGKVVRSAVGVRPKKAILSLLEGEGA